MGDTFWMEDRVRVNWERTEPNFGRLFGTPDKPGMIDLPSFMDPQFKESIFDRTQYPESNTGSQYLDPAWRHKIVNINSRVIKIEALISLN